MDSNLDLVHILTDDDLQVLVASFNNGSSFAEAVEFGTEELKIQFLDAIGLSIEELNEKHYYFDSSRKIHISESEHGYIWISTMGLVAKSKPTNNQYLNACGWQKTVLVHLLDDAILLAQCEASLDVDSCSYSMIEQLTPALFHNTIFYLETLAKAYLSICGKSIQKTHNLASLYKTVKATMFEKQHNNTMFHQYVLPAFESMVRHISSIPGSFREEYVKYDDNPHDYTIVEFNAKSLCAAKNSVEITFDIVSDIYCTKGTSFYVQENLYQRLIDYCENDADQIRLENEFSFLLEQP